MHFADASEIPTPGDRGKTTRRKSTHTVRGPEGQWIAQVKEDLAADKTPRYRIRYESHSEKFGDVQVRNYFQQFADRAEAETVAAGLPGEVVGAASGNPCRTLRAWVVEHCGACQSTAIVHTTPSVPGPVGWVARCKDCGHHWSHGSKE